MSLPLASKRCGTVALLGLFASLPAATLFASPIAAQSEEAGEVRGSVHVTVGATSVKDKASALWGIGARLHLGDFGLGGGGYVSSGAEFTDDGQSPLSVELGYGGVEFDAPVPWVDDDRTRITVLLGGGNAEVVERFVGREISADNFLVIEPRLSWSTVLAGFSDGVVSVGYRSALGVDDLPGVGSLSLSGLSVSLTLSVPQRTRR